MSSTITYSTPVGPRTIEATRQHNGDWLTRDGVTVPWSFVHYLTSRATLHVFIVEVYNGRTGWRTDAVFGSRVEAHEYKRYLIADPDGYSDGTVRIVRSAS